MHGPGACTTEEDRPVGHKLNFDNDQNKKKQHEDRHDQSRGGTARCRAAEAVTGFEKPYAGGDSRRETRDTDDGVHIPACQSGEGTPGTTEEHQRPHHGEEAEDKTDERRRPSPRPEFPECEG